MKEEKRFLLCLIIIISLFLANKYNENHNDEPINNMMAISEVKNKVFDKDKHSYEEIIQYTNEYEYPITLNKRDIKVSCDIKEVENYYDISVLFSKNKNGEKTDLLTLKRNETAYIFVISEYDKEKLPNSNVKCRYDIALSI